MEWLDEQFPKLHKEWTVASVMEFANGCTTKVEFRANGGVYEAAKRLGIYNELAEGLEGKESWTTEKLQDAANKYNTRKEFREGVDSAAYHSADRRGVLDEICSHMTVLKRGRWGLAEMIELAKQYSSRSEFEKAHAGAYIVMLDNGWKEEVCGHMEYICRPKWTKEELKEAADKYSTVKEFEANERGAYCKICKEGLLDELCSHMVREVRRFTEKQIEQEVRKYTSIKEIVTKDNSLYLVARRSAAGTAALSKLARLHVPKWTEETIYSEASSFADQSAFVGSSAYQSASRKGILQEVLDTLPEGNTTRKMDTVYVWEVEGYDELYKIGVTCSCTKSDRPAVVARYGGLKIKEVLVRKRVGSIANRLEKELLEIGEYAVMDSKFNGSTEFRYMTEQQLKEVMDKIEGS